MIQGVLSSNGMFRENSEEVILAMRCDGKLGVHWRNKGEGIIEQQNSFKEFSC